MGSTFRRTEDAALVVLLVAVPIALAPPAPERVNFHRDVAPILFEHCASCHREGGVAPFPLTTYAEVRERAPRIAAVTGSRVMPPWLPAPGPEPLVGERRLSEKEIEALGAWAAGGALAGDPGDAPPAPQFAAGWQLGAPDLSVAMPESYRVPESGPDLFRSFVVPVPTRRDRFVRAMEFRPGSPGVVHHAVVLVDRLRSTRHLDALDPAPGWAGMGSGLAESPDGHFVGWTPGKMSLEVPEGMPWRLARGSDLVLQLHLLPRSDAGPVRVRVGFHFADEPPARTPTRLRLGSKTLDIPAGEERYRVRDRYRTPVDLEVVGLYPHAHYLAREMKVWAEFADGRRRALLHIPRWDFLWQDEYRFVEPVFLPAGAALAMEFTYDNSAQNPRNPHQPPRRVLYGPESSDEMADLWVQVVPRRAEDLEALQLDFARKETNARLAGYRFKLETNPHDETAHYGLAGMLAALERRGEAMTHLRESLRLRPDFAQALNDLGRLHLLDGEVEVAVSRFRAAIAASPELPQAHHNLGAVRFGQGRADEAEAHYRRALGEWPDFAEAHYGLGEVLESRGRRGEALEHFRQAIRGKPGFALARFRLGNALAADGDDEEAVRQFDAALASRPDLIPALFNRAAVLARTGRLEEAEDSLRRLLDLDPDHREARALLARIEAPRRRTPREVRR